MKARTFFLLAQEAKKNHGAESMAKVLESVRMHAGYGLFKCAITFNCDISPYLSEIDECCHTLKTLGFKATAVEDVLLVNWENPPEP